MNLNIKTKTKKCKSAINKSSNSGQRNNISENGIRTEYYENNCERNAIEILMEISHKNSMTPLKLNKLSGWSSNILDNNVDDNINEINNFANKTKNNISPPKIENINEKNKNYIKKLKMIVNMLNTPTKLKNENKNIDKNKLNKDKDAEKLFNEIV